MILSYKWRRIGSISLESKLVQLDVSTAADIEVCLLGIPRKRRNTPVTREEKPHARLSRLCYVTETQIAAVLAKWGFICRASLSLRTNRSKQNNEIRDPCTVLSTCEQIIMEIHLVLFTMKLIVLMNERGRGSLVFSCCLWNSRQCVNDTAVHDGLNYNANSGLDKVRSIDLGIRERRRPTFNGNVLTSL